MTVTTINGIEGFSHNGITYTCNTSTNRCYRDVAGCKTRISLAVYRQCREEALAPKAKAPRRSKNTAYTKEFDGVKVALTTKQVDFIKHVPDTDFYESGLDSTLWIDVLIDQITNGMGAMTIGAMVSTLRQKGIIMVGGERINGRESKCFKFTGLGKQVAADLGLK